MIIKNRDELLARGNRAGREQALDILEAGVAAADPYENTRRLIRRDGSHLVIGDPAMDVSGYGEDVIDLDEIDNVYVVGAGKAIQRQAQALEDVLGDRLTAGAVTVKKGEGASLRRIEVTEGAHPVPDEQSVAGARKIMAIADRATERDLVFTIFSDGASSLFSCAPAPGLTLDDTRQIFNLVIKYGFQSIAHRVLRYCSAVNAGRILQRIQPARSVNLIMQVGRYRRWHGVLPSAGSWVPTMPPFPRRLAEALVELKQEPWWDELTPRVRSLLERQDPAYDVPALDDFRAMRFSFWQPVDFQQMLDGARARAEALGIRGVVLASGLRGHSAEVALVLSAIAVEIEQADRPFEPPVALITSGELYVPVGDATGIGGRNQEFVLASAATIADRPTIVVASIDSDGTDGPGTQHSGDGVDLPCMAGGIIDGETMALARERGVDVAAELRNHNATIALHRLGSAIHTGNTGTCVGDLRVTLVLGRGPRQEH